MSDDSLLPPNRERAISRETATEDLAEGLENESLTPRQMESVQLIEDEYGREAIAEFRDTGTWPEGAEIENSHLPGIETEPELATHPGDLVPKEFHRFGVHGGDTNEPLGTEPLDPEYAERSGFQILDEDGQAIGQAGTSEVEESGFELGELTGAEAELGAEAGAESAAAVGAEAAAGEGLGAGLTAIGEGILAAEAAGGAEIEAATGPVGWVVGGAAVLVAGAALGAGYLLGDDDSADASQAEPESPGLASAEETYSEAE